MKMNEEMPKWVKDGKKECTGLVARLFRREDYPVYKGFVSSLDPSGRYKAIDIFYTKEQKDLYERERSIGAGYWFDRGKARKVWTYDLFVNYVLGSLKDGRLCIPRSELDKRRR
jgi:hypothetical protein